MFRHLRAFILAALLPAPYVGAQVTDRDTTFTLPEITVFDERAPFYENDSGAHVTHISAVDLERSGSRTVGAALNRVGGVFVRQYGANGSAGVTLRGTGTGQAVVLLDGLPLDNPQLGQVDLSLLPTSMLSGVDVLHGGASSLVGSGAMGGAISLRSVPADTRERVRLSTSLGAWGERRVAGRLTAGSQRLRAVVAAEVFSRDGDFPYTDHVSLPAARRPRENADRSSQNVYGRLVLSSGGSTTEVAGLLVNADRGLPGIAGSGSDQERQQDRIGRLWIRYARAKTTVSAASQWQQLTYTNPVLEVRDRGRVATASVSVDRQQSLGPTVQSTFGLEATAQSVTHPSLRANPAQYGVRAFILGRAEVGRLRILPSVRGDWISRAEQSTGRVSPALRVRLHRTLGLPVVLKSGVSSSFRAPTHNDLFWRGQGAEGNMDLRPEKGFSADFGAELEAAASTAAVSLYYQSVRDQIVWQSSSEGVWSPENIGRVRTRGLEASVRQRSRIGRSARVEATIHYTYTDARDRTDRSDPAYGSPLRHVPRHLANLDLSGRWRSLEAGVLFRYTGRRYMTTDASEWLAPHGVIDGRISYRITTDAGSLDISLFVENLGGRDYEIMSGYPMPPRHARLQLSLSL